MRGRSRDVGPALTYTRRKGATPSATAYGTAGAAAPRGGAEGGVLWRTWGPYLSERQWGTVREDYSDDGNAWDYFSHDQARSRAYHWGEDGLAGFSDDKQQLCFALALWNGRDPILKERLFGLTNSEANHGEDVKEYYFYLDSTPTPRYMKWLYKYPQAGLSLRRPDRDEQATQPWRHGIRAPGYGYFQRRSVLRCRRGICQADTRGPPHPDQRV